MRRALIVSMDGYRHRKQFRGHIRRECLRVRQVLGDPLFGEFYAILAEDEPHSVFESKLSAFFKQAKPVDSLLLMYSGHAECSEDNSIHLLSVDTPAGSSFRTSFPISQLEELILQCSAEEITIIFDCCNSTRILNQFTDLKMGKDFGRHLERTGRSVQILASGDNSTIKGNTTDFTRRIVNGIVNGSAGSLKPTITLLDLANYVHGPQPSASPESSHHFRMFGIPRPHLVSWNPHHSQTLPKIHAEDLESGDVDRQKKAITALLTISLQGSVTKREHADKLLELFIQHNATLPPAVTALLKPWQIRKGQSIKEKRQGKHALIVYNTRNYDRAQAAHHYLQLCNYVPLLFDLDAENQYWYQEINLLDWLSQTTGIQSYLTLWILDAEFVRRFRRNHYLVTETLNELPGKLWARQAVFHIRPDERALPNYLSKSTWRSEVGEGIQLFCSRIVGETRAAPIISDAEPDARRLPTLAVNADLFFIVAEQHAKMLLVRKPKELAPAPAVTDVIREPNFLLFKRQGRFVMAICDKADFVNELSLQYTFETPIRARKANDQELAELGFIPNRVHPHFTDPRGSISNVFIDGIIFFQYLMFPKTLIQVPNYTDFESAPRSIPISAFIRTILQLHGVEKVIFSRITERKRFTDEILLDLISKNPVHTRFAPTPSNSLHIGSLRTALLSYLFSQSRSDNGRFHLRFDDTSVAPPVSAVNRQLIQQDLEWFGVPAKKNNYRQSDPDLRKKYDLTLALFEEGGLCSTAVDGAISLEVGSERVCPSYWLDLKKGPQIRHNFPTKATNGETLDYTITKPLNEEQTNSPYKYKFAGAIDDLMYNSLVLRDVRQDHSAFTLRQAGLMVLLRELLAHPGNALMSALGNDLRKETKQRLFNRSRFRPFPFPCPPIYFHVSRVSDSKGKQLSKRMLAPEHSIQHVRKSGVYFPETLLVWCLKSFGVPFMRKIGLENTHKLLRAVTDYDVRSFLTMISKRITPVDLISTVQSDTLRIVGLRRIDHALLQQMTPARLKLFANNLYEANDIALPPTFDDLLSRLYRYRASLASAAEVSSILLCFAEAQIREVRPGLRRPNVGLVGNALSEKVVLNWINSLEDDEMKWVRYTLTGSESGPPIKTLLAIFGCHKFSSRLQ